MFVSPDGSLDIWQYQIKYGERAYALGLLQNL